jgi:predicted small secreted protein
LKQYLISILAILVLVSGLVAGCATSSGDSTAKKLSFATIWGLNRPISAGEVDDIIEYNGNLHLSHEEDIVEHYTNMDLKKSAAELSSGYSVHLETLRKSTLPFDEIEHIVKVYKTEDLAKKGFSDWSVPGTEYIRQFFPCRTLSLPKIGDESKAWISGNDEWDANKFLIVFRKGKVLEAIAVDFTQFGFLNRANWIQHGYKETSTGVYKYPKDYIFELARLAEAKIP